MIRVCHTKNTKIPYFIIIGDKDIDAGKITLESRDKGNLGQKNLAEVVKELVRENEEKR